MSLVLAFDRWLVQLESSVNLGGYNLNSGKWSRRYLGMEFFIWIRGGTWFWFVVNPSNQAGMIGATSDESGAVREARFSVGEILAGDGNTVHPRELL